MNMGINKKKLPVVGEAYYCTEFYFYQSNSHFNITCKTQINFKYHNLFLTRKIHENINTVNLKRFTAFFIYPMFCLSMAIQKQIHTKFYPLNNFLPTTLN